MKTLLPKTQIHPKYSYTQSPIAHTLKTLELLHLQFLRFLNFWDFK